jgi:hypothetical protein
MNLLRAETRKEGQGWYLPGRLPKIGNDTSLFSFSINDWQDYPGLEFIVAVNLMKYRFSDGQGIPSGMGVSVFGR